jgi:hypothetical protein
MSSRLIKSGSQIEIPGDEVIVSLKIYKSNKIQLEAPLVHPRDLCKMLSNLIYDITYASLQGIDVSKVDTTQ